MRVKRNGVTSPIIGSSVELIWEVCNYFAQEGRLFTVDDVINLIRSKHGIDIMFPKAELNINRYFKYTRGMSHKAWVKTLFTLDARGLFFKRICLRDSLPELYDDDSFAIFAEKEIHLAPGEETMITPSFQYKCLKSSFNVYPVLDVPYKLNKQPHYAPIFIGARNLSKAPLTFKVGDVIARVKLGKVVS